ncbi:MAG: hypothetical protein U0931_27555 [Vulcanimicrobiota bacterium]
MNEWVDYLRQHKPAGLCSLCEIPLTPEHRAQLLNWPAQAKASRLEEFLRNDYCDPARQHSAADALALTLLWFATLYGREHASEGEIWPPVSRQFPEESRGVLFAQGHPRAALKWALESCCRRFDLRHAFGRHGGQAYYLTVYLQFGFTRNGMLNLSQWLTGYGQPTAVRILLQESATFRKLWASLQANQPASENPFWPEGWKGQSEQSTARLVWDEQGPWFQLDFARLFPGLEDGSYQLAEPFEFFQVIEGVPHPASVLCQPEQADLALTLTSLSTGDHFHCEVSLWTGELQFWDEHGKPRKQPSAGGTIYLPEGYHLKSPARRQYKNWAQLTSLPLELADETGQPLEWATASAGPLQKVELTWEHHFIRSLPHRLEGVLRNLPADTRIDGAEISEFFGAHQVQVELPPTLRQASWTLRLRHQGRTRTLRAPLNLELVTWQSSGEWRLFEDQGKVDLGGLPAFRFLGDFSEFGLLEGHRFLGRPPAGTAHFRGLSGYGAPLILRRGPFNPLDNPDRRLFSSLCNHGVLQCARFEGDRFQLTSRIQLSPKHFLLFWDGCEMLKIPYVSEGQLPLTNPLLVAVGYGSAWLGSVWTRNCPPQQQTNPRLAAHLMRWAHMALLEYGNQALARHWMRGKEFEFLSAWMEPELMGLAHREDEGWFEVLRALFPQDVPLNSHQARSLLKLAPWQSWLRIHPGLLERLLSLGECSQEIQYLARLLDGDLESRVEQEMGVDRGWLQHLLGLYFERKPHLDLDVALAFPSFQQLVLRESLR